MSRTCIIPFRCACCAFVQDTHHKLNYCGIRGSRETSFMSTRLLSLIPSVCPVQLPLFSLWIPVARLSIRLNTPYFSSVLLPCPFPSLPFFSSLLALYPCPPVLSPHPSVWELTAIRGGLRVSFSRGHKGPLSKPMTHFQVEMTFVT